MLILYTLTLFLSATLLFTSELMFARMILPLLGGTPAVWNTCMLFFQTALLAAYAATHLAARRLSSSRHILTQLLLTLLPLLLLPIHISTTRLPPVDANPIPWLLLLLLTTIGLPFFALATIAPTLQKWFSRTNHPSAADPYFLYSASNLGSLAGLIGYVLLIEPRLTLADQRLAWSVGYFLLFILLAACAITALRCESSPKLDARPPIDDPPIPLLRRLRWIILALIPSSLMLGVTSFLTSDVATVPLLWVIPLALYLLTFMLAFARRKLVPRTLLTRLLPVLVLLQMILLAASVTVALRWIAMALHLLTFFIAALVCHTQLADDRPSSRRLTDFYLLLSLGGAAGGILSALVAPLLFTTVLEYPIALLLACLLLPSRNPFRRLDLILPPLMALATFLTFRNLHSTQLGTFTVASFALGAALLFFFAISPRSTRFALCLGAVLLTIHLAPSETRTLYRTRSFFGTCNVHRDPDSPLVHFAHGTTIHGTQSLDPAHRAEPLTYFHRSGPIGQVLDALNQRGLRNVAVAGLGTGSLAAYAQPGQHFTYYEIDPAVLRIASDTRYFTFLHDASARGADLRIILGDARLKLASARDQEFDLIVLDAFSSDSVPTHLLTRQALHLYLAKLAPHGTLAFNITNRYLELIPVVRALAADSHLIIRFQVDRPIPDLLRAQGKLPSTWAVMARCDEDLSWLHNDPRWQLMPETVAIPPWTDDFSNILQTIKWR